MGFKKYTSNKARINARKASLKYYKDGIYAYRLSARLCTACGKPRDNQFNRCDACRTKLNRKQRERRQRASFKVTDKLVDKGYITVKEAAEILNCVPNTIHTYYIRTGKLAVRAKRALVSGDTYWVSERDVNRLKYAKLPNYRCTKCQHVWRNVVEKPKQCPKCQSKQIIPFTPRRTDLLPDIPCTRLKQNQIKEMLELRKSGATVKLICKQFGVSVKTFYKYWNIKDNYLL